MKVARVRIRRRRTGVRASRVTAQNSEEVCDHLGGGRRAARPSPRLGGLRERASAPPQPPPPPPGAGFEPTTACCDARGAAARALLTPRRIILRRRRVRRRGGCQRRSRRLRRGRPTQPVTAQLGTPELELVARRDSAAAAGESSTVIIESAPPLFWSLPSSLLPSPPLPSPLLPFPPLPSLPCPPLSFPSPFPSLYVVWHPSLMIVDALSMRDEREKIEWLH